MTSLATATAAVALTFTGMRHLGIHAGFDLQYTISDSKCPLHLCVGSEDNRVLVTGTTPLSRQAAVLQAIDDHQHWGEDVDLWMIAGRPGAALVRTRKVAYRTPVQPYEGSLTVKDFKDAAPKLLYPGNGKGRTLSKLINGRRYFLNGSTLETDDTMRGFDCTTFPMALLSLKSLPPPGYGKQLCDAALATPCGLDMLQRADLEKRLDDGSIPAGLYIVFSEGHVLLLNATANKLYEFNYGGFFAHDAGDREMPAKRGLWWLRKLDEAYRPCFDA